MLMLLLVLETDPDEQDQEYEHEHEHEKPTYFPIRIKMPATSARIPVTITGIAT